MQLQLLPYLRCPLTKNKLQLQIIEETSKQFGNEDVIVVSTGFLVSDKLYYPIIDGIPRLIVEAIVDYEYFFKQYLPNYIEIKNVILSEYAEVIKLVLKKNQHSKKSFTQEWGVFNYDTDGVWDCNKKDLLNRFLTEIDATEKTIQHKVIFDAGCGNGLLDNLIANAGATVIAMDFSESIIRAYTKNNNKNAWFIQGDIQYPPIAFGSVDILQCSGVAHHTNNTELTFTILNQTIKNGGLASYWLYHKRKNFVHNFILWLRNIFTPLPLKIQYYFCLFFLMPPTFLAKKIKGKKTNVNEIQVNLLDGLTPEFRWVHTTSEVMAWYSKNNFSNSKVTTTDLFGFNIIATKN